MKTLTLVLALLATMAGAQTFPPDGGGGGAGGAFTAPQLGPTGCVAPPYSFTGHTTSGVCYGLAAAWVSDSVVIQADDYETLGYGTTWQMASVDEDPGFIFGIVNDANFNGSSYYFAAPEVGGVPTTPWANFVLFSGEFTTGTGALVTIDGTARTNGVAEINLTAVSDGDAGNNIEILTDKTTFDRPIVSVGVVFANLGTPADGTLVFCSDCTKATPCAAAGPGALAKRLNGAWDCD